MLEKKKNIKNNGKEMVYSTPNASSLQNINKTIERNSSALKER